ncbi:MAG: sensor histidine kinase, partial [Phycisphaerae bacterium]
ISDPERLCTGTPGRIFSVPIRSGDQLMGIVAAMLPSQMISEELESSSLSNAVLLARETGSFDVCTDFPVEMNPWFHERFSKESVRGFFERRENAFYADRYAALWTPVHFPGDRHWRIAFLYDEQASLKASGVGSGLTGLGTAGLVLLLGGAVIILCKAIRARERSESRARRQFNEVKHIYNTSPVGLCFLDRNLRFVRINEQLAAISGRPALEHIGRPFRDVLPQIAAQVEAAQRKVLCMGETVSHVEVQGTDINGTQRVWLVSSHPMRTEGEIVSGVSVVVQDITMRVHAEEQARQRQADLAHMTRLGTMGEMASGLAHELNQPLASIVNYIQACAVRIRSHRAKPEDLLEDITLAAAQAQRAGAIIDHLRRVVRKREPQATRVDLNDIVRDAAGLMKAETRPNGLQPRFELQDGLPLVQAECIQIEQVIINLMRNSVDALREIDPDRKDLVIHTEVNSDGAIEFSIHDTGTGLDGESLDRAFEPYFTTKEEGMGMGLSISRSIIEGHGGRLWAMPNRNHGTTFKFTLPVNGTGGHNGS